MKTITSKTKIMRSLSKMLLLTFGTLALTLVVVNSASAQDLKEKLSRTDNILEHFEAEKIDTSYTYKWDNDSQEWTIYNRELKYYDKDESPYAQINQRHLKNGNWENYDRTVKSYDEKGKLIENLHQKWSPGLENWVNLKIKTITYNERGERSEVLYHEWQQALDRWISTTRYLITYNRNGEESNILIKTYSPATNTWSKYLKYSFVYEDHFGDPDETHVEEWDPYTESWENRGKYLMGYDARGNRIRETHVNWNESMDRWVNGIKYLRDYTKRQLQTETTLRWNFQENEWTNAVKNIYEYDEEGEMIKSVEEKWNRDSAEWEVKNRYLYSDIKEIEKK